MSARRKNSQGSSLIEFTLVGIPLIFILISTFEMGRGMWAYGTLAAAVREGTRFAVVHGQDCATAPNNCQVTVAQIAQRIQNMGVGLLPDQLNFTLSSATRTVACNPLQSCLANTTCFPTAADCSGTVDFSATPGMPVTIDATYPFQSAIAMFWPGNAPIVFGVHTFRASSRETIQF